MESGVHPGVRTSRAATAGRMKSEAFTTAPGTSQPGPLPTMPFLGVPWALGKHGVRCFQLPLFAVKSILLCSVFGSILRARTLVTYYLHPKPWAHQELESSDNASRHVLTQANRTQEPSKNKTQKVHNTKAGSRVRENLPFSSEEENGASLALWAPHLPAHPTWSYGDKGFLWVPDEPQIYRT